MLYGHIETFEHRVDHLLRLRALQDETQRLPVLHPARVPQREQQPAEAARADRGRRPAHARGQPADARQHRAHQGVLGVDGRRRPRRSRCASAPTTSTARSCTRPSTTRPAARVPMGTDARRAGAARSARPGRMPVERDTEYSVIEELPQGRAARGRAQGARAQRRAPQPVRRHAADERSRERTMQSTDKKRLVQNRYKNVPRAVNPGGRLRLVGVSFLNAQPILHGLLAGRARSACTSSSREPAELGRAAARGRGRRRARARGSARQPRRPRGRAAASRSAATATVRSVVLVGERPIEELDEVLLDASSRTSVVLARLVLKHLRGGSEPRYCSKTPSRS